MRWPEVFPNAPPLALDLLDKMLKIDPRERVTVEVRPCKSDLMMKKFLILFLFFDSTPYRDPRGLQQQPRSAPPNRVQAALEHPWLASLHDLNDEPICPEPFSFEFENVHLDGNSIRELLYREILSFHPDHAVAPARDDTHMQTGSETVQGTAL